MPPIDKRRCRPHLVIMAKIEIYTKAFCPYCTRALQLLARKAVTPEEIDITNARSCGRPCWRQPR